MSRFGGIENAVSMVVFDGDLMAFYGV